MELIQFNFDYWCVKLSFKTDNNGDDTLSCDEFFAALEFGAEYIVRDADDVLKTPLSKCSFDKLFHAIADNYLMKN